MENAYEKCLFFELNRSGVIVEKQKGLPLAYDEVNMNTGYGIDLIDENKIITEIKSVYTLKYIHLAQILT